jgi:hypothetical protein
MSTVPSTHPGRTTSLTARIFGPFAIVVATALLFAGCGGSESSARPAEGADGTEATQSAGDTTVADPFAKPEPELAELGKPAKVGDVDEGKYVTITIEKVLGSEADEADPTSLRVSLAATAEANAAIELSGGVWCKGSDDEVPQGGTLGGDDWDTFASGGMVSFEKDAPSPTEPLIVRVPSDCEEPALQLTPATIEGMLASGATPVRWNLPDVGN